MNMETVKAFLASEFGDAEKAKANWVRGEALLPTTRRDGAVRGGVAVS